MRHLQFKFHPDPTKSADTCHFVEKWMESFEMQPIGEMSIKCGLLFIKNGVPHFGNTLLVPASQITPFWHLQNGKLIFCARKMKTPFGDIVWHSKIHTCSQYGRIITNYATVKVMRQLICLESHETSYIVAHFREHFFKIIVIFQVCYLTWKLGHIK